jgi:mannose-6-phosphate isomerase-like protein (cupin superfamily)
MVASVRIERMFAPPADTAPGPGLWSASRRELGTKEEIGGRPTHPRLADPERPLGHRGRRVHRRCGEPFDGSGDLGQWHHHGDHHVVAYVLSGTIRVEYGPGGRQTIDATAGDLVHLEPATIHREAYGPGEVASVGMYFGTGPGRVDVEGPEGEG